MVLWPAAFWLFRTLTTTLGPGMQTGAMASPEQTLRYLGVLGQVSRQHQYYETHQESSEGLGLQGRISLFVNSEPYFWILFQKLCIALLRNKSERAPNLIIMSRKASENGDHHSLTIDIWYLVTWKAIETRWNIVTRPKIEVSRSMLPFFRGDLPTSQALGKNQED